MAASTNTPVARSAHEVLSYLGPVAKENHKALIDLWSRLLLSPDSIARYGSNYALRGLRKIGDVNEDGISALIRIARETTGEVQCDTLNLLSETASEHQAALILDTMIKGLLSESAEVRGCAANALSQMGKRADPALTVLAQLAKSDEQVQVRRLALRALLHIQPQNASSMYAAADPRIALPYAVYEKNAGVVKEILSRNPKMQIDPNSLAISAEQGTLEIAQMLMAAGASVNAYNDRGRTALMEASESGHAAIVQFLLANGADVKLNDKPGYGGAINRAATRGHTEIIQILLNNGADINQPTSAGFTPVWMAAYSGKSEAVRLLLKSGARREDALDGAQRQNQSTIIQMLENSP